MTDDVEWIRRGLETSGKSRSGLAAALGRFPSAVTDLLNGKRRLQLSEVSRIAEYLSIPAPTFVPDAARVSIEGLVGAGGEINTDLRQTYDGDVAEIELDIPLPPGLLAYEVWGISMLPKYDPGDVVLVQRAADPTELVLGDVALVATIDGRRFLKRVLRGSDAGLFDLESFNAPTMKDERLGEVGRIYLVVPANQVRRPVAEKEVARRFKGGRAA